MLKVLLVTYTVYLHQNEITDTIDYSNLILQTSDGPPKDALLYSKHKRPLLENSEDCHTPVKIQRFTCTQARNKVIINDKTQISVPDRSEFSFQYVEIQSPQAKAATVAEISESSNEWDLVTFCGKVAHVGQIRIWNDKKKLSTTPNSVITQMVDATLEKVSILEQEIKSHDPVVTLKVESIHSIQAVCFCSLPQTKQCVVINAVIPCAKIVIRPDSTKDELVNLTAFQNALENVIEGSITSMSGSDIAEQLLLLDNLTITYNRESPVITEIVL